MAKKITDKERLDWLMEFTQRPENEWNGTRKGVWAIHSEDGDFWGATKRQAIDAAIRAERRSRASR